MKKKVVAKKGSSHKAAPKPKPTRKVAKKPQPKETKQVEVVVAVEPEVEVTLSLPEVPEHHVTVCLPCGHCGKPVNPAELPVVLEWGKKSADSPAHLGRPWKRVAHLDCDREVRGIKPKEHNGKSSQTPLGKNAAKVGNVVEHRKPRSSFSGKSLYLKTKTNPRKEGTHGHHSFSLIKNGMTYEQYIEAGGRQKDLAWDVEHGWVEVK